jgi:tetratricopeptide (TPR) repeat protein
LGCNNTDQKKIESNNNDDLPIRSDKESLLNRANFFYKEKKYIEAIPLFDSLISMDSTTGVYYFKRGYCKTMLLNNPYGAIADFKAIERNYFKKSSAYLNIGVLYSVVLNKPDSSIYYYNECLKIDPNDKDAKSGLEAAQEALKELN